MAFYIYDISFLVIFTLAVVIFLYRKRANLKREGLMYLYRTQVGVRLINYIGKKYKRTLKVLSYLSIACGYILMVSMLYLLGKMVYIYLFNQDAVRAIKIPPLMPLIPYLPEAFKISFLPPFYFTYWIVAIAVIAVFHEFSHGIFAKRYGIKIKTTGFGFLGPFLAAFVEPNEKQMNKKPKFQQLAILSAGTFANLILAVIFFLILALFFTLAYMPAGSVFNTYTFGQVNISSITSIGNFSIKNTTNPAIIDLINENNISDDSKFDGMNLSQIKADNESYFIPIATLKTQLEQKQDSVIVFSDLPAIRTGLEGVIVQVNDIKISTQKQLSEVMNNFKPGDEVKVITKIDNNVSEYDFKLGEDPANKTRAVMGIGFLEPVRTGIMGYVAKIFTFFKDQTTYYEPRFNAELVIFIYNLIWWLALINLSVALVNMWPMAIFDGGRFFMLTVWGITGSEKFAKLAFKFMTYLLLGALVLLMLGWARAIF